MKQDFAKYKPSFVAAKLYRKKSEKGATYFTGRMGSVKLVLLKSKDLADDGTEIWELKMSEAQPYKPREEKKGESNDVNDNGIH